MPTATRTPPPASEVSATPVPLPPVSASDGAPTASPTVPAAALTAPELARFLGAFNDAAARLQATHDALHAEVRSLKAELLEANQQVERSRRLAALGEMAAGIAHEIRNPLGSIRLYARMLHDDLADRPDSRDVARKIAGAVTRLDAVVGDVLSFAREIRPRVMPLDSAELLREALAAARADDPAWHGIQTVAPPGPGPEIHGDPTLLHQALVNLIRNAVEAMADQPAAPPAAPRVLTLEAKVRRARANPGVALVVRDTGPGIPPEVMKRMFNPFFTTRAQGTGLGLAIVHRIVDAHGGRTVVTNLKPAPGQPPGPAGAQVELVLPPAAAAH